MLIATMQYGRGYSQGTERYISMLSVGLRAAGDEVVVLGGDPEGRGAALPLGAAVDGDASLRAHPVGGPMEVRGLAPEAYDELLDELRPDVVLMCCPAHIGVGVLAAARRRKIATAVAVHDYWWTCPKHGLDHWSGRICGGDVPWRECVRCMSHQHPSATVRSLSHSSIGSMALPLLLDLNWRRKRLSAAKLRDWRGRREILKSELRACDAVIFPSRMAQRVLAGWAEPAREHWIPNGIEQHWFEGPRRERNLSESVAVRPESLTIGLAGALTRAKGPHVVLAGLRRLDWSRARVLIAGRGLGDEYEAQLRVAASGLAVEFLGPVKSAEMPAFFDRLDLFIVPSLAAENHPIAILEATARGVAVIGSDHGGVAELLDPRNQFRAGDADALAERLRAWTGGSREAKPPPVISAEEMVERTRRVFVEARNFCGAV
ncbi:MAG: glycosyltransferase [Phycisphaerae bacterium]